MDALVFAPAVWPGEKLKVEPGDLTQFAPLGMNLDVPLVVRPWDTLERALGARNFYGLQAHSPDPFRNAPLSDPAGGTLYVDDDLSPADLTTMLQVMRVSTRERMFAAFHQDADNPLEPRFLAQLRLVSHDALRALFGAGDQPQLVTQPTDVGTAIAWFLESERARWGTGMSSQLSGTFGGDGDWAKESLCFGFTVENAYHGVYRIWSRAWLVTK